MPRHPSKGTGWGGPAKGAGRGSPRAQDDPALQYRGGNTPKSEKALAQARSRAEQAELVKDEMLDIALHSPVPADRIQAGRAFLDRVEGTPVARQMNINVDATTEQAAIDRPPPETRDAWLERKRKELGLNVVPATRAAS